ncbi:Hypothetical predicted protein [Octopus vulgaris]|uniref:Uncharacterized protein n=1 Tax=Octopus vulgaris TaxID=6645 RepID=A0AA36APV4_OCTVU|nr:Hypothetical predicted protein [Octopus vulgaris]
MVQAVKVDIFTVALIVVQPPISCSSAEIYAADADGDYDDEDTSNADVEDESENYLRIASKLKTPNSYFSSDAICRCHGYISDVTTKPDA